MTAALDGHPGCSIQEMQIGTLYEHALDLSPRAARIAVGMLALEPDFPEPLRRSLRIALSAVCVDASERVRLLRLGDRDARAARSFLTSCRRACQRDVR